MNSDSKMSAYQLGVEDAWERQPSSVDDPAYAFSEEEKEEYRRGYSTTVRAINERVSAIRNMMEDSW